jgi:hypothetical protein
MVTIAEVAQKLNIPATTAREYVKRFRPFFPTKKVAGSRFLKYPDIAFDVLQDIIKGYKNQLSTEDVFDALQQKYPLDVELLDQQQRTQNMLKSTDDMMITATPTSQTSVDVYTKMQVAQFQTLNQMTKVLENNNKLMERLITLLEGQYKPRQEEQLEVKRTSNKPKKSNPKPKQAKKKGLFSFFKRK